MRNEDNWESSINRNMSFLMNDPNIMFGYMPPPPYGKNQKIEKCQTINFDECP